MLASKFPNSADDVKALILIIYSSEKTAGYDAAGIPPTENKADFRILGGSKNIAQAKYFFQSSDDMDLIERGIV